MLLKAYIHRYKYRPFNLVVGSLTDKKMFRLNHFLKEREHMNIENEFGSVCNLNDFNKNLEK